MPDIKNKIDHTETEINTKAGDFDISDNTRITKTQMRAIDALRTAEQAEKAAIKAREDGKDDKAEQLEQAADKLKKLVRDFVERKKNQEQKGSKENPKGDKEASGKNKEASDKKDQQESGKESDKQDKQAEEKKDTNKAANKTEEPKNDTKADKQTDSKAKASDKGSKDSEQQDLANEISKNSQQSDSKESSSDDKKDSQSNQQKGKDNKEGQENQSQSSSGSDDSEDEDSSNESSDTNSENIPNPFKLPKKSDMIKQMMMGGKQVSKEALLKKIKEIFAKLTPEEKARVKGDINSILTERGVTLTDNLHEDLDKEIQDYTDDEFTDEINKVVDLIAEVDKEAEIIDTNKQKAKVKQWTDRPGAWKELQQEDNINIKKGFQKTKARQKEIDRYNHIGTITDFKLDFYETIKDQVKMELTDYQGYDEINAEYEDEDMILKADSQRIMPTINKPVIDLYFDMSGSWTGDRKAIDIGKQTVATIKEFADKGEIDLNVLYFSSANYEGFATSMHDSRLGRGTQSWDAILQNIKATNAKNVVLMTDWDMDGQAENSGYCEVEGCVWFIWKDNNPCPAIIKKLRGRQGTSSYGFNSYE